jgi:threonine 3-dehydrogenase
MKALVKSKKEPGLWMEEVPKPTIGHNDVLVKVRKTGICGTDIHIYNWDEWSQRTIQVPMHIGHEFVGEVAEVGSEVTGFKPGDRVSGEGHITCGNCRNCRAGKRHLCRNTVGLGVNRPGCFAEFVALPSSNIFRVPREIPDEIAAFFDPLGNAVHTALSFDLVGEDVLITGAGPIGIMAAAICAHVGARNVVVTDVNEYRLGLAKKLGATHTVNIATEKLDEVMKGIGMTEGFDVGLEMSGNGAAFKTMFKAMNHGGRVALLGIPVGELAVDWNQVIFKGLVLKGVYGREMFETWYKMTAMLQSGLDIAPAVTHRYPIADFKTAFEVMRTRQSGKVVLDWGS